MGDAENMGTAESKEGGGEVVEGEVLDQQPEHNSFEGIGGLSQAFSGSLVSETSALLHIAKALDIVLHHNHAAGTVSAEFGHA